MTGSGGEPGHGPPCSASPYPSPPLSTHGRGTADLRWSPVSQLGVSDDSWTSCGGDLTLSCRSHSVRSSPTPLPGVDLLAGSGDVMAGDFDMLGGTQNTGRQNALTAYTGLCSVLPFSDYSYIFLRIVVFLSVCFFLRVGVMAVPILSSKTERSRSSDVKNAKKMAPVSRSHGLC